MKLLIVEDSAEMRSAISDIVDGLANEIHECADGSEVMTAYENIKPDWVFMDLVIKQMDGLEITKQVLSIYPEARIAIVTSYDDPYLRNAAFAAGARAYVLKENLFSIREVVLGHAQKQQDKGTTLQ